MRDFALPVILLLLYTTCTFNPFGVFGMMNHSLFFVALVIVLGLLLVIVARRVPRDEREVVLEAKTSHSAYLAGQVLLLVGIFYERLVNDSIEGTLIAVFLGMTIVELFVRKKNESSS